MFERFAASARKIVVQGVEEARDRGDRRVGTDHLLVALLADPDTAELLGTEPDAARAAGRELDREALAAVGIATETLPARGSLRGGGRLPFTAGARDVMRRTLEHAVAEKPRSIGPKHLMLALLDREQPDPAATLLTSLGVDGDQVREKLRRGSNGER
jgi:ATP-dependent Clp protease ATP-binding subunit ClpA